MNKNTKRICAVTLAMFYGGWAAPAMQAYAFNMLVPDVRQPAAVSGGSACPVRASTDNGGKLGGALEHGAEHQSGHRPSKKWEKEHQSNSAMYLSNSHDYLVPPGYALFQRAALPR